MLDNEASQMELAFGILGVTTRDWARLGWLYVSLNCCHSFRFVLLIHSPSPIRMCDLTLCVRKSSVSAT